MQLSRHPLSKKKLKIDLLLVKQHLELDHKGLGLLSETTNLRVAVVELGLVRSEVIVSSASFISIPALCHHRCSRYVIWKGKVCLNSASWTRIGEKVLS